MLSSSRNALLVGLSCALIPLSCAPRATTQPSADKDVVTAADIEQFPDQPLEMVIQRKVSGVAVIRTDGGLLLQIRGAATLMGDPKPPLYIVDGMRVASGTGGEMPSVDPKDVETIKVLKGADAAIYGIEGANGVIVITTKRGK